MFLAAAACVILLLVATVVHYEVLRALSTALPAVRIAPRAKLILVIVATFFSHAAQVLLYALTYLGFVNGLSIGAFKGVAQVGFLDSLYFSAETFTSLGFGDITPAGPLQLIAGSETLIGLLLIGWSASYTFVAMERFWAQEPRHTSEAPDPVREARAGSRQGTKPPTK
ncbi:MAG TPA: potassium channel family protein [Burkholderiales bacterium]|jgi:voltage-gated potassium channel Kch|nr:potassium channel family protein [Burkholderiales bacterium]